MLRLAVITDIHYGPDYQARLGSKAPKLLPVFMKAVAKYKPDAIINLGDDHNARAEAEARQRILDVQSHFNRSAIPIYKVQGNHDVKFLSRDELAAINGCPATSYSRDVKGYHLVFWNPGQGKSLEVTSEDLKWLEADLATAKTPAIVFSHVPLDLEERDFAGNDNQDIAGRFHYAQSTFIRDVLEKSGKVVLCVAGHRHRHQYRQINGIHYIEQQSLTQMWKEHYRIPHRTWAWLEAEGGHITLRMQGHGRPKTHVLDVPIAA